MVCFSARMSVRDLRYEVVARLFPFRHVSGVESVNFARSFKLVIETDEFFEEQVGVSRKPRISHYELVI